MNTGGNIQPERSLEDLLSYARTMESEAAMRYAELAGIMETHNNREVAELFHRMAKIEWLHVYNVGELARDLSVSDQMPPGAGDRLRGAELPDTLDMHYLQSPRQALELAYSYEQNAARFYKELAAAAHGEELRAAALQLAAEEESHMRELERWLARFPQTEAGWDEDPDPPNALD